MARTDTHPGSTSAELRIESEVVHVSRIRWPLVALALALLLGVAAVPGTLAVLFALLSVGSIVGYMVFFAFWDRSAGFVVRVPVSGVGLIVQGGQRLLAIGRSEIVNAWHWPEKGSVTVAIATRSRLVSIRVPDEAAARALGRALGIDSAQQLVGTRLTACPQLAERGWRRFAIRSAPAIGVFGLSALFVSRLVSDSLLAPNWIQATFLGIAVLPGLLLITRGVLPVDVAVGRDGVLISFLLGREFIGYERIARVRLDHDSVVLTLANGDTVSLPMARLEPLQRLCNVHPISAWMREPDQIRARRQALFEQIHAALARFRAARAPSTPGQLLERGPRTIAEWRSALTRTGSGTYREPHLDPDHLADIVENPQSPLEQRLGAALALADVPGDERKLRVRAAVASSANTRVRVALEKAADGSLDDEAYEAALVLESAPAPRALRGGS